MYFTQEKNKFERLHIIVTLIALFMHQIAHWSGYQILRTGGIILRTFFMYQISSLNNESYCCGIKWSESLYCCGFRMLSIVLLVEKIPVNFLAVTMNQYISPPIAQLISASHIKTAPSCIRELVNE